MSPLSLLLDCCVHCILACLFCEFLTLCNIVLDCATCGSCAGDESCFCCCCASEECGDCDLPCDMDCGIIDACCESADCLEICMECCSLCFSSWGSSQLMRHRRCTLDIPASPATTSTSVLLDVFVACGSYSLAYVAPYVCHRVSQANNVTGEFFNPLLIKPWGSDLPYFAVGPLLHSSVDAAEWVRAVVHECPPGCADQASTPSRNKLLFQWSHLCCLNDWSSPSMKNDLQRQMRKWLHLTGF